MSARLNEITTQTKCPSCGQQVDATVMPPHAPAKLTQADYEFLAQAIYARHRELMIARNHYREADMHPWDLTSKAVRDCWIDYARAAAEFIQGGKP